MRAWFAWHRWLSLGVGLLAVSLSLTGPFLTLALARWGRLT